MNINVDEYYTRLKIMWDKIMMLRHIPMCKCDPVPACTCDVLNTVAQNVNDELVMNW